MVAGDTLYAAELERRGLTPNEAHRARMQYVPSARAVDSSHAERPCIVLPYFTAAGQFRTFERDGMTSILHRVRYLGVLPKGRNGKDLRYSQPLGSQVAAYFPQGLWNWPEILSDPRRHLILTEGEFKAYIASREGFPTIGLGGVYSFKDKATGRLLPELEEVVWHGRAVFIVYDYDAKPNRDVIIAQRRLAVELRKRGATVHVVELPPGDSGSKQGLDDFLLAHGAKELERLLDNSPPFDPSEFGELTLEDWITEINQRHAIVRHGGDALVAIIEKDPTSECEKVSFMKVEAFQTIHRNKFPLDMPDHGRRSPVGKLWLDHPARREYPNGVTFAPGRDAPPGVLNLYRGWRVQPAPGDWSLMQAHIRDNVCGGDTDAFNFALGWLASAVRNLDKPLGVALVLRGGQGSGKGILGRAMGHLFATHSVHLTKADHAVGRFNAALGDALFVFADEAFYAADPRQSGALKALITEDKIAIEAKFRDPIMRRNTVRLFLATNEEWAIPADVDDRRFAVFDVAGGRRNDRDYFGAIQKQLEAGGYAAMLHDLLRYDLTNFDITKIPDTRARADQKLSSLKGAKAWLYDILHQGAVQLGSPGQGTLEWGATGISIDKDSAYASYVAYSKTQREYRPAMKAQWSKDLRAVLGHCLTEDRPRRGQGERQRRLVLHQLADCRAAFARHIGTAQLAWEE